jgi:hypothetical protein
MSARGRICLTMVVLALTSSRAAADFLLTFEGLKDFEHVDNYYNGGKGSLGSGPGTNYGISFTDNALAYIHGQQSGKVTPFSGDPSPSTVLILTSPQRGQAGFPGSFTMDVAGGFTQYLAYYYINIANTDASVQIYSGLDGTGTLLAQQSLPSIAGTNPIFSNQVVVPFNGTAYSVVFSGNDNQLALDNIAGSNGPPTVAPTPASWLLLLLGCGVACAIFGQRRGKLARALT